LKPPEEVRREFSRQWLRKGLNGLASAKHMLSGGEEFAYVRPSTLKATARVLSARTKRVRTRGQEMTGM